MNSQTNQQSTQTLTNLALGRPATPPAAPVSAAQPSPAAPNIQPADTSAPAMPVTPTTPAAPPPTPDQQKQSRIGQIFQAIAGGQKTVYDQTPQGPVPRQVGLKPGEIARNILASAFSLMAAGAAGSLHKELPADQTIGGMRQESQQQTQQQTQQQFQNKQAADWAAREASALADEQTLAHARDAREQLKSIQDAKLFDVNMKREQFGLAHDQIASSLDMVKYLNDQTNKMEIDDQLGIKRATIGGADTPNFTGPDAMAKMQAYATKNAAVLTQKGFNVQPRWTMNPDGTMSGYLVEIPQAQGPIPVGFKLGKDGQPLIDGNGNRVPDGSIKGPDGKPTGFMAPDYQSAMNIMLDQKRMQLTDAQIKDVRSQAVERNTAHAKDAVYQKALDDYTKHNGDPSLMDAGDRLALLEKTTTDWLDAGKTLSSLQQSGASADVIADATRYFQKLAVMRLALASNTNSGVATVKQMREAAQQQGKQLTDAAIFQAIDQSAGLTKTDKAAARQYVIGADFTLDNLDQLNKSQKQDIGNRLKNLGWDRGSAMIQTSALSDADKKVLLNGLQNALSQPATLADSVRADLQQKASAIRGAFRKVGEQLGENEVAFPAQ